jgi:iron complex outermembrane receptor protein
MFHGVSLRTYITRSPSAAFSEARKGSVNLNLGIGSPDGRWCLGAFARNLFDTPFQSAVIGLPFSNASATVNWETREGRRTVGDSLESHF